MDPFNPDTWKQQWGALMSAPYIIPPLMLIAGWIGWWFRKTTYGGQIAGLNERISVLEERLRLASDKAVLANEARNEVNGKFQALKAEVAAKPGNSALAARVAALEAGIEKWSAANNAVSSVVGMSVVATARTGTVGIRIENDDAK